MKGNPPALDVTAPPAPRNTTNPDADDFDYWGASKKLQEYLLNNGYPVPPSPAELKKRAEDAKRLAAGLAPKRRGTAPKRKKGDSDYALAKAVVEEFDGPLAFVGGNFWSFSVEKGWEICDRKLENSAHERLGRNADNVLVPIIRSRVALPSMEETATAPIYWERLGGRWEGRWEPLALSPDQVLYTDGIYSLEEEEATSTAGRIIWGPMVSTPWGSEDAPDPDEFDAFVAQRIPDEETRRHFQEVCGTILQPHIILRGQIVLWGPPKCGKTALCMALACAPAGALGVAQQQEVDLVKNKWSRNQLVNRFVNISDDSVRVAQWTGFVKRYTSGVLIAEPKYGKPATMAATAKLISTCNEMQDVADASGAMVDRLFPFRVENRVGEGEENPDFMSIQHWSVPKIRASIIEWMVQGLSRLRKRRKFAPPESWLASKQEAVSEGDPLECWIRENLCKSDDEGRAIRLSEIVQKIPADILRGKNSRHLEMMLGMYLERLFNSHRIRIRKDGERHYAYSKVTWVD